MEVRRIQDGNTSLVEPALNAAWDEYNKLLWKAAVIKHDTGLIVEIKRDQLYANEFCIQTITSYHNAGDFNSTWRYLNGMQDGAEVMRRQIRDFLFPRGEDL